MKNEILFVLLNEYADYEPAYISGSINCGRAGLKKKPLYINKVVAPTMDLVRSVGGFIPNQTILSAQYRLIIPH